MPINTKIKLLKKEKLKEDVFKFTCEAKEIAECAKPGQFIEIQVTEDWNPRLRRPISIHNVDKQKGEIEFIFQIRGKGTLVLSETESGEILDVIGPLGDKRF